MRRITIAAIDWIADTLNYSSRGAIALQRLSGRGPARMLKRTCRESDPYGSMPQVAVALLTTLLLISAPQLALAQASPFLSGATALQTNLLAWLTPIAIILVMVLGGMAMANRLSWGWCFAAILGIAIGFGAPQIVTWVRGMFGV